MAKKPAKKVAAKAAKKSPATKKVSEDTLLETYESIKSAADGMGEDIRKFVDEKIKASGKRARQAAQEIKKLCMSLRKDIMVVVKSRKGGD